MEVNNKRGQLALFIIVGVIIVGGIVGYFAISQRSLDSSSSAVKKFPEFNSVVGDCLEGAILDGIYFNSLQGGYYDVPEPKKSYEEILDVPFFWVSGQEKVPKLNVWEDELEKSIKKDLSSCMLDSDSLLERGYNLSIGGVKSVNVDLSGEIVKVSVDWPITIFQGDNVQLLSKFQKSVDFNLEEKHDNLVEFMEMQKEYPNEILLTRMANFSADRGFVIEGQVIDETLEVLYAFVYENEKLNDRTYTFMFGARY